MDENIPHWIRSGVVLSHPLVDWLRKRNVKLRCVRGDRSEREQREDGKSCRETNIEPPTTLHEGLLSRANLPNLHRRSARFGTARYCSLLLECPPRATDALPCPTPVALSAIVNLPFLSDIPYYSTPQLLYPPHNHIVVYAFSSLSLDSSRCIPDPLVPFLLSFFPSFIHSLSLSLFLTILPSFFLNPS